MPFLRLAGSLPLVAGALLVVASGCAPITTYRNTSMVPNAHPIAWDGRIAAPGTVRIEGTLSTQSVTPNYLPLEGDSALRVAQTMAEGAAFISVSPYVELGARAAYAGYAWTTDSAIGTQPIPSAPSMWGGGFELRLMFPIDPGARVALGLVGNYMSYQMPYANWQLSSTTSPCMPSASCVHGYRLLGEGADSHGVFNAGLVPSVRLGSGDELGHVFGWLGLQTSFKNQGFTNASSQGASTLDSNGFVPTIAVGYGKSFDPLRFAVSVYAPLGAVGGSPLQGLAPSIGGQFTVGVDLDAFRARKPVQATPD